MPNKNWRNVFISHVHEDDDEVGAVKALLEKNGYAIRDSSITSEKPNNAKNKDVIWRDHVKPGLDWAGTLVVTVSEEMRDSEWVDREIRYAAQHDMRIVGVWTHGAAESDLPPALNEFADAVVGWQAQRVEDAIEGKINNWETPDGKPMPNRKIKYYNC